VDDSKFLITGANGQLGMKLQERYPNARATDSKQLDITDWEAVKNFDLGNVTTILNAAAYTDVDGAETGQGRILAWKVNANGPSNLARIAREKDITVLHISSDYVFDGSQIPHKEDEPFSPLSVYGASKAAGDIALSLWPKHYILRTSWVIGEGKNFVRTMLGLGHKSISPKVVDDQIGRLTFTPELVKGIDYLLAGKLAFGTYNLTNGGEPASWADITRQIFSDAGFNLTVTGISTDEYFKDKPQAAHRPANSVMDLSKFEAANFAPKDWRTDLADYLKKELSQ
jgi:dTDP-4-dehydrorhamnose 3,5-epimerase